MSVLRILRTIVGAALFLSSALGLLGFPSDAPTWYRCLKLGGKACPGSITLDPSKVWNILLLLLGLVLLVPGSWWRRVFLESSVPVLPPDAEPLRAAGVIPSRRGRIFVDVTPQDLMGLFQGRTTIEAERLVAPYLGKWMKISRPVSDVNSDPDFLTFSDRTTAGISVITMSYFSRRWRDRLSILRRGDNVTVTGRIENVSQFGVRLADCELE